MKAWRACCLRNCCGGSQRTQEGGKDEAVKVDGRQMMKLDGRARGLDPPVQ